MITLSPSCLSAQQIAAAVRYQGDWRELRFEIDRLNPGLNWGALQAGQQIRVPIGVHPRSSAAK